MSITTVLNTATSGLMAAQLGIRTVSDNVANANTPGYVRKVVNQTSLVTHGVGSGVHIEGVTRVVDQYLQTASLTAGSQAGGANVMAEMLDRMQGLFGDPGGDTGFFSGLDAALSAFGALADDPASSLQRSQALSSLQTFFDDSKRITSSLAQTRQEADVRIQSDVNHANDLLAQIASLNVDIRHSKIGGVDSSGSENIQSQLLDELSGLVDVQAQPASAGGIVIRTKDGMLLADERGATLAYNASTTAAGYLTVTPANSGGQTFDAGFANGELVGLLQARNKEVPAVLGQLAEFTAAAAREINRAHNASSAVPAPPSLTGRATGLDLPTALGGFSGTTTIALLDSSNVVQNRIDVDFTGGTMSLNGGAATAFTPATFLANLNAKLGANGTASFTSGALSIAATSGGVAIQDDATTPSMKAGQGFSQFFGMNDLIRSSAYPADTGLSGTDPHGFTAGQTISLRLSSPTGERLRDVTVTVPAGATMNNLLTAMNAAGTGVAPFGQFALDANGRLNFSSGSTPPAS
ncbi:MAG: flagellar hook-associated protein FlgK, partial [Alphaproteobacteria bacterium]